MFVGELFKILFLMIGFLDKNCDIFSVDFVDLVGESKFLFLFEFFFKERVMVCIFCYCFISLFLLDNYFSCGLLICCVFFV